MNKKLIRLTEQDLHRIVKESVQKILNEIGDTEKGQFALGSVYGRNPDIKDASDIARKHRSNKQDWCNLSNHNAYVSRKHGLDKIGDFWEKEARKHSKELGNMTKKYNQGLNYGASLAGFNTRPNDVNK